jgi:molecular chaperone DnaK (HSP70)
MTASHRTVGLDFGTSTSLVAEGIPLRPALITPIGRSTSWLPSWVGVQDSGLVVGEDAQDLPLNKVARSVKRAITHNWSDIQLEGDKAKAVHADEAVEAILREIGIRARSRGVELTEDSVRLGCPAMWNGPQRNRLLHLARSAGLPVSDHTLVDEPVAAGVAWVTHRTIRHLEEIRGRLLVFDMGGGTLDIAVLDIDAEAGRPPEISVLASVGRDEAGDLLDQAIAEELTSMYAEQGISRESGGLLDALVLQSARRAKEMLTHEYDVPVSVRHPEWSLPTLHYSRAQLEVAFQPQLQRAADLVWAAIREARMTHELGGGNPIAARRLTAAQLAQDIDYVLLVGGMSRIPLVSERMGQMFPGVQIYDNAGVAADEAIVAGLSDTAGYDKINLHRPGFSFVLEWPDGGSLRKKTLYGAYTPFYTPSQAMQRAALYYEWLDDGRQGIPERGEGLMRIESAEGGQVDLVVDGATAQGLAVPFGHKRIALRLFPNGRIVVSDGTNRQQEIRVKRWPVLRGREHAVLVAERVSRQIRPVVETPWYYDYENMRP